MTWITPWRLDKSFQWPLTLKDKITIFGEQTLGWHLDVANTCINGGLAVMRHSGFAVLHLAFSYFETIARFKAGDTSTERSGDFFRRGVLDVVPELQSLADHEQDSALTILYRSVRCGFYHESRTGRRLSISGEYTQALRYDPDSQYVRINPHLLLPRMKDHLAGYLVQLADPGNAGLRQAFERRFDYLMKWDPLAKPARNRRSDEELRQASRSVAYESGMMSECVRLLMAGTHSASKVLQNALLEAFGIHGRCIAEFLYPVSPWQDDVVAADYFDDSGEWESIRPEPPAIFKRLRRRVGREMVHLSYRRVMSPEDRLWNPAEIWDALAGPMRAFLANVPDSRVDGSLREVWSGQGRRTTNEGTALTAP